MRCSLPPASDTVVFSIICLKDNIMFEKQYFIQSVFVIHVFRLKEVISAKKRVMCI